MDSVHAFPPHNASYRLNHLSFFCIYGGLRRQNKQAATDGSHKKAPPPVAGFAKKRTARKFHFFPVFHSEKSKKSKTTSRLSARGARIRSRNDAAQQPRSAGDTAVVDTHCAGAGPPRLILREDSLFARRACVGKPNAPRPSAQKAVSHTGGVVKGAAESTRVSARPTQTPAKAFSGIAPAPIARPRSDSRNAAGAERPPYSPAELFIDR